MNTEWRFIKPLKCDGLIEEFEVDQDYEFPNAFKECIKKNNGGRPEKSTFDTDKTKERYMKSLLSFNKENSVNIWSVNEWVKKELAESYIAFAIDNFGNLICFDIDDNSIVFWDHETNKTESVAETFDEFLDKLYE